jgi:hypothetical protein
MPLDFWYKVVTPRDEVRKGRSFNPDEFAIALEQVVAGTAPEDYQDPEKFFSRTCFTRALRENAGIVLRRLAGETANTAPVLTLVTQFGGGKTHTLTALYHLAKNGSKAASYQGVDALIQEARLATVPEAKVAVFVGNAWDPQPGREMPWIDMAWQIAGDAGVQALGPSAKTDPPGTDTINRVIELAGKPVLILCDEVLNGLARHRWLAEPFHSFLHNLMRGFVGKTDRAAVISLPRSQTEMTEWEIEWQDKILKIVGAVAKPVIVNDEAEISEVLRRRLFEDIGDERTRKRVAKAYADWYFDRRAQLPPEFTAVDTATTETKAREFLQSKFEACYPFHPGTLSVFQRKWQTLPQYQQTRGTLAMLAQWISWAYRDAFTQARHEPLITLGSAPLDVPEFRSVVLGQLGEPKLMAAIDADIAGAQSHARALDVDTKGSLKDIHRRVGTAMFFESSGGQLDRLAHLPELRYDLCEPDVDTTSVDTAALALEARAYYVRKVGADGFRVYHKPTLKKVVNDRRASLDDTADVQPAMRKLIQVEFEKGKTIPIEYFRGNDVSNSPKLTLQVVDPNIEWDDSARLREQFAEWTKRSGTSDRLYPGALVWCLRKPGRELRDKVENMLAWRRVRKEVDDGTLGNDFEQSELSDVRAELQDAENEAREEVWASYRFLVLADNNEKSGVRVIDLSAGHSGHGETLCGRVIAALKTNSLLNESPGVGWLDRKWPPALKESGAWSLLSLRQAFLTGALDRVLDPDAYLRAKLPEFVERGDFGFASGQKSDSTYERVWFKEFLPSDEITFESDVYLLKKQKAQELKSGAKPETKVEPPQPPEEPSKQTPSESAKTPKPPGQAQMQQLHLFGNVPSEMWNRIGTKLIPKLRSGQDLKVGIEFTLTVNAGTSKTLVAEINQILEDLGIKGTVKIDMR